MTDLCDTNIISELAKPQLNSGVVAWSSGILSVTLSVITLEEISYGLSAKPNVRIQAWFETFLGLCQIIPLTPDITRAAT